MTKNTRVKKRREPIDYENMLWLNRFREKAEVFQEYPFASVFRLKENLYGILHETPDGTLDSWSYILLGTEKALLIDTGYGIGDYRGLAEKLCEGRPWYVVNTHPHPDHIGGNFQFEKVYCHSYAVPYLDAAMSQDSRKVYLGSDGQGEWLDFQESDLAPFKKYETEGCEDGRIFELGDGYPVELLWTPGHACGGCCFLDYSGRSLFSGDEVMAGRVAVPGLRRGRPYEEYSRVKALEQGLMKIASHEGDFDLIYPGHHRLPLEKECVNVLLETCTQVIEKPGAYDRIGGNYIPGEKVYLKEVPDLGVLEYKPDGI